MPEFKYKFQMYKHLQANAQKIYAEAKKAAEDLGIVGDLKGNIGLTGRSRVARRQRGKMSGKPYRKASPRSFLLRDWLMKYARS